MQEKAWLLLQSLIELYRIKKSQWNVNISLIAYNKYTCNTIMQADIKIEANLQQL